MRKLVLAILALLAVFSVIRAYTQAAGAATSGGAPGRGGAAIGLSLHPGLVEVGDGTSSLGLGFGLMERGGAQRELWSLLPIRMVYTSGDRSVSIGLNGLSFLLRSGVALGRPVLVDRAHTGDVISVGGKVTVDSSVDGDVWTLGADVQLTARAQVSGDVVTLGGRVISDPKSVVRGSVSQLPQLKVPFLGVLGSDYSAQALLLARHILAYVLLGCALFAASFYLAAHQQALVTSVVSVWRPAVITVAVSLVALPVLAALLIASGIGVFLLPLMALGILLLALDGFLAICSRFGWWLRRSPAPEPAMQRFTSGLLGLFLIKLPSLLGIPLTLIRSQAAARMGDILQQLGLALVAAGLLYGFGATLAQARTRSAAAG